MAFYNVWHKIKKRWTNSDHPTKGYQSSSNPWKLSLDEAKKFLDYIGDLTTFEVREITDFMQAEDIGTNQSVKQEVVAKNNSSPNISDWKVWAKAGRPSDYCACNIPKNICDYHK